ncbi:hypothetical protein Bca52824_063636 [Brassica carinata]|uniref:Uncharacterized protein n=1 Tax=Brassica carinata TaxID=52824 RepID=A0A8X7QEQ3_BRACI|nr:hypothetical protein Bca52824_063636 [Brassica carinata]
MKHVRLQEAKEEIIWAMAMRMVRQWLRRMVRNRSEGGETEADKEAETEEGKTDVEDSPSTLQVMAEAGETSRKRLMIRLLQKAGDELAAAEKAASDKEKVGDEEETRPKRTHKSSR